MAPGTHVHFYRGTVSRFACPGGPYEGDGVFEATWELWPGITAHDVRMDDGTLVSVFPDCGDDLDALVAA